MYNTTQILYIVISLVLTVAVLVLAKLFIKNQRHKDIFLKFWALATFITHISIMWVSYLKQGRADAPDNILFPIYFCNACMYALMVVAFIKNKQSKLFKYFATFVAWGGFFGAIITLFECHYFAGANPDLSWYSFKSMLSHSAMMVGCLYLFVGGYVKIRVSNLIPFAYGLLSCFIIGLFINWLFVTCGLPNPNAMYLTGTALEGVEFLNGYFIAGAMVVLIFIFSVIWEQFACKKGNRWYNHLAKLFKKKSKS